MTYIETVTHVSVEWILKNVTYSVDGFNRCADHDYYGYRCDSDCSSEMDWQMMIEDKFWDTNLQMMLSIMESGIRNPICLRNYHASGRWEQGNGHHRLAMAILTGMESVPVVFSFEHEYMMSWITG